jgi:hypothetical protein
VERVNKSIQLFDLETMSLQVKNPFGRDGVFQLKLQLVQTLYTVEDLVRSAVDGRLMSAAGGGGGGGKGKKRSNEPRPLQFGNPQVDLSELSPAERKAVEEDLEIEMIFKSPIWCNEESVAFTNGRPPRPLQIYILPFLLGKYTCQLVFVDKVIP